MNEIKCREGRDKRCRQGTATREPRIRIINDTVSAPRTERAVPTRHDTSKLQYAIRDNLQYPIHDKKRNVTMHKTTVGFRDFSGRNFFARTTRGRPASQYNNILGSSDSAPLAPNHTRA